MGKVILKVSMGVKTADLNSHLYRIFDSIYAKLHSKAR